MKKNSKKIIAYLLCVFLISGSVLNNGIFLYAEENETSSDKQNPIAEEVNVANEDTSSDEETASNDETAVKEATVETNNDTTVDTSDEVTENSDELNTTPEQSGSEKASDNPAPTPVQEEGTPSAEMEVKSPQIDVFPMELASGSEGDSVKANFENNTITISGNGTILEENWINLARTVEGGNTSYNEHDYSNDGKDNPRPYGWQILGDINMIFESGSNIHLSDLGFKGNSYGWFEDFRGDISFNDALKTENLTDMSYMFCRATKFNDPSISSWNTENVVDMGAMFAYASKFNQALNWDTGSVTNMHHMFMDTREFNQDISNWDTSKVNIMTSMFLSTHSFNQDISKWDTSSLANMSHIFSYSKSFNYDISNWKLDKVSSVSNSFKNAKAIKHINLLKENTNTLLATADTLLDGSHPDTVKFNKLKEFMWVLPDRYKVLEGDLGSQKVWVVDKNYPITFEADTRYELEKLNESDSVDYNNVDKFSMQLASGNGEDNVFATYDKAAKLITISGNGTILEDRWINLARTIEGGNDSYNEHDYSNDGKNNPISFGWQIRSNINMVFEEGSKIKLDKSAFNDERYFHGYGWFEDFKGTIDFNHTLDTSEMTHFSFMFCRANKFNDDISDWDTSHVKYMNSTFCGASTFNADIAKWETSNVINMYRMFRSATKFNRDISYKQEMVNGEHKEYWNTNKAENMGDMFYHASSFNQDISNWKTSKVSAMHYMFNDASSFNQNINSWDTSNLKIINRMFYHATAFNNGDEPLNLKLCNISSVAETFENAKSLKNIDLSNINSTILAKSENFLTGSDPDSVKFDKLQEFTWDPPSDRYLIKKGDLGNQTETIVEVNPNESITFEADTRYEVYKLPIVAEVSINDFTKLYDGKAITITDLMGRLNNPLKIEGRLSFKEDSEIVNIGEYKDIKLLFTPKDLEKYQPKELSLTLMISEPKKETRSRYRGSSWKDRKKEVKKEEKKANEKTDEIIHSEESEIILPFSDISMKKYDESYHKELAELYKRRILVGVSNNSFMPELETNRAMVVTVLHRLSKEKAVDNTEAFKDVIKDKYYEDAVKWGNQKKIVFGYDDENFKPERLATREELITMFYRYSSDKANDTASLNEYKDSEEVSAYARDAMNWAVEHDLLIDIEDKNLHPKRTVTRYELVKILSKFIKIQESR